MTHINLLPWRALNRAREKKQFRSYLLAAAFTASIIVLLMDCCVRQLMHRQLVSHHQLKHAISKLDIHIKSVNKLHDKQLSKMNAIQHLTTQRVEIVFFLNALASIIPVDVVLTEVQRLDNEITLSGYSESASHISTLMRNIADTDWIKSSDLPEINKKGANDTFKLRFILGLD